MTKAQKATQKRAAYWQKISKENARRSAVRNWLKEAK